MTVYNTLKYRKMNINKPSYISKQNKDLMINNLFKVPHNKKKI